MKNLKTFRLMSGKTIKQLLKNSYYLFITALLIWMIEPAVCQTHSAPYVLHVNGTQTIDNGADVTEYACDAVIAPFNGLTYKVTKTGATAGNAKFFAGRVIYLEDGFEVVDGGEFWAWADSTTDCCGRYCGIDDGLNCSSMTSGEFRFKDNLVATTLPNNPLTTTDLIGVYTDSTEYAKVVPTVDPNEGSTQSLYLHAIYIDKSKACNDSIPCDTLRPVILMGAGGSWSTDGQIVSGAPRQGCRRRG